MWYNFQKLIYNWLKYVWWGFIMYFKFDYNILDFIWENTFLCDIHLTNIVEIRSFQQNEKYENITINYIRFCPPKKLLTF